MSISRRNFLKGAAGVAAMSMLGSTASAEAASPIVWDYESDLVIVGGGSSLFGAYWAAHLGKSITILEKLGFLGGTSITCGGGVWAPCNRWHEDNTEEEVVEYLKKGDLYEGSSDESKIDYVYNFHRMIEYTADEFGFGWNFWPSIGDYDKVPFAVQEGRTLLWADAEGNRMRASAYYTEVLIPALQANPAVNILTECPAQKLITDETGRVIGVEAQTKEKKIYVKANTAVLMATGGFDWNEEMCKKYLRGPLFGTRTCVSTTGDGIRMGMAVGCDLANMQNTLGGNCYIDEYEHGNYFAHNMGFDFGSYRANAYTLLVNKYGRRFMDESVPYSNFPDAVYNFDTNDHSFTNIPAYLIFSQEHVDLYGWPNSEPEQPAWVKKFDTLDELAAAYGIKADFLKAEVERFNGFCETGIDEDFSRGTNPWSYGQVPQVEGLANHCLGKVTAPYYVCMLGPGSLGTKGGIKVNIDAQAINVFGEVIPGLYASGTTAAGPLGWTYGGAGGGLGPGIYQAMKAINHMFEVHMFDAKA